MRLERLTLENFRGFESLDLTLHPRLTVLVGVNGSGKTSILHALVLLFNEVSRARGRHAGGLWLPAGDIRLGSESVRISFDVTHDERTYSVVLPPDPSHFSHDDEAYEGLSLRPVCAYSVRREAGNPFEESNRNRRRAASSSTGRPLVVSNVLFEWLEGSDFARFFDWFLDQEDIENERRLDDPTHRDPRLEAARQAIERLMPGYSGLRIRRARSDDGPQLTLKKNDQELDFSQLSEGERVLSTLVGDIARRTNSTEDGEHGIVLIDEIDLHLHPKWQATVLPSLLQTFPDIQFVVTTHSPIVLSHVDSECVRLLEDFRLVKTPPTNGRDPNAVLSDVFGVPLRPAETQAQLDRIAELIDEEQLEQAKEELERLGTKLGREDLEVTRLRGVVELMEV